MSEPYQGNMYRCPWCALVYSDPHERDGCTCPNKKHVCVHGIEWDHKSSADYCGCDDDE